MCTWSHTCCSAYISGWSQSPYVRCFHYCRMLPNFMRHSSPLQLFSTVVLGLVLGLFSQEALLLSPDGAALSSLAKQLGVDPAGDACSWPGITCEASRVVKMYAALLKLIPKSACFVCIVHQQLYHVAALSSLSKVALLTCRSLRGYNLTGTLPQAWGQLSKVILQQCLSGSLSVSVIRYLAFTMTEPQATLCNITLCICTPSQLQACTNAQACGSVRPKKTACSHVYTLSHDAQHATMHPCLVHGLQRYCLLWVCDLFVAVTHSVVQSLLQSLLSNPAVWRQQCIRNCAVCGRAMQPTLHECCSQVIALPASHTRCF